MKCLAAMRCHASLASAFVLPVAILFPVAPASGETSVLWGEHGESWSPQSRLPDFSHAGYHNGEETIPKVPVVADVTRFGAKGDGVSDDTPAFLEAVKQTKEGAIFIPEGRYVLTDVVKIAKSNLVLRGAGPDKTVLVIPKSLTDLQGAAFHDGKSNFSFRGGFIEMTGKIAGNKLADVVVPAKRGDRRLVLSSGLQLKPGTFLRLVMTDADHSLGTYLHAEEADAGVDTYASRDGKPWIDIAMRVVSVSGGEVTFDRPLRVDVRLEWKPEIHTFEPTVSEVGIEDLSFEFPGVPKKAHLLEVGFNAIHMINATNCWVRNVGFTDADNSVIVGGCRFCTVEGAIFKADKRSGLTGHHALWATGASQDCLFSDFRFETTYEHDLTVEGLANGNVFRRGRGVAINIDHHRNAPYENLFTDIDLGDPRRVWTSGGRGDRGPHSGARETFWNLRASTSNFPKLPDWPQMNLVGVTGYAKSTTADKQWIEPAPEGIQPADLYDAQLDNRLKKP